MDNPKPDYALRIEVAGEWQTVGVAWTAKNGTITMEFSTLPDEDWNGYALLVSTKPPHH